ncbi:MAG: S41 family peptidase [Bacteroidota bacterium]
MTFDSLIRPKSWLLAFAILPVTCFSQSYPSKLDYALEILKMAYVDTVNEKQLTDEALKAMIKQLDPHSVYVPPEEMREVNEPLVGKFEGVGVQFNIHEDTIMVTMPIPGGPSEKLGIRAGDRIVRIDGENMAGIKVTNNDVFKRLRGPKGTKVNVSILRRNVPELIEYTITRDQIPLFSMDAAYMVTPTIGYIKISRFADSTPEEFRAGLEKLKQQGLVSLVLDLQGNGGGYLNRAVELADEFLPAGKKIVYTRGRTMQSEDFNSSSTGSWEKGKVAILIDESSASASEIVSGAVQDWDRGLIVGRRSFGKGLVQRPFPLQDGSMIRITVAHYYTPSGRCIQKPYILGEEEEYEMDFSNRLKNGELFYADSIKFNDSTDYYTGNGRIVRGGGGIMPDLFVPLDTSNNSIFYSDLLRKGVFNDFSLTYVDNNRASLKAKYADASAFNKGFILDESLFQEFLQAAYKAGVKEDDEGLETSGKLVRLQLKALFARNLWDTEAYFIVINDVNQSLRKAIEAINDNTFEKMRLGALR